MGKGSIHSRRTQQELRKDWNFPLEDKLTDKLTIYAAKEVASSLREK